MIVAGEASGDRHAARLVSAMAEAEPDTEFEFFGSAGVRMREAGVDPVVRADDLAIVGVAEIARALPMFIRVSKNLKKAALERIPDVVVLVDFPDFNLRLAKWLKNKGFKVVYYISPQLWAWRKYRVSTIRNYVDLLLTILPFEKAWYSEQGVDHVEYVGNPLSNEVTPTLSKDDFCAKHELNPGQPIIALLPGSRHKEIVRILPRMLEAASEIAIRQSEIQFVIAIGQENNLADVENALANVATPAGAVKVVVNETYDAINSADAAAVTSGTATLETGILGTPLVVVYAGSALNYFLLKPLISVAHYGLINLIAEKRIAKELIQDNLSAKNLSDELFRLLTPEVNSSVRKQLKTAREKLGAGGASARAAAAILRLIDSR